MTARGSSLDWCACGCTEGHECDTVLPASLGEQLCRPCRDHAVAELMAERFGSADEIARERVRRAS